jgi:hypothetical protein
VRGGGAVRAAPARGASCWCSELAGRGPGRPAVGAPVRCPHPGRGVGSATVAPAGPATRELRGRDRRPRAAAPAGARAMTDARTRFGFRGSGCLSGCRMRRRGCGSDRTGCVSQLSPALALESTQFLYSTPANSSPEKARARSQECTSKRSRTCHPGYAVWCGKCAELRRRSAPLGEPATHMPARHAAP